MFMKESSAVSKSANLIIGKVVNVLLNSKNIKKDFKLVVYYYSATYINLGLIGMSHFFLNISEVK